MVQLDPKAPEEIPEMSVFRVLLEWLALMAVMVTPVCPDLLVLQENLDHKVMKVYRVWLEPSDILEFQE